MSTVRLLSKNDETEKLVINERAIEFIQAIREPISVAIIVGPYRSGKSFLINNLFHDNNDSFSVGHTDQSHTKGVWLSKKVTEIRKRNEVFKLLIMDTEGLESLNNETWDTKLFLVSILMSSLFIYNTKCALSVDAFNKLSMIAEAEGKIKQKNGLNQLNGIANDGPDFLWIVRDFSLELTKSADAQLIEFLTNEDVESNTQTNESKLNRNRIRKAIKQTFRTQSCFYLQEPELDVNSTLRMNRKTLLQNLEKLDRDELSVEFRNELNELSDKILNRLVPKKIKNQKMNGQMFCDYLRLVVEAVNEHKTFYLHDAITKIESQKILDEEKAEYKRKLTDLVKKPSDINEKPISMSEFELKEREFVSMSENKFDELYGQEYSLLVEELKEKFNEDRDLNEYRSKVISNIKDYNSALALSLWNSQMKYKCTSSTHYESIIDFDHDFLLFKYRFKHQKAFGLTDFDTFWIEFETSIQIDLVKSSIEKAIENERLRKMHQKELDDLQSYLDSLTVETNTPSPPTLEVQRYVQPNNSIPNMRNSNGNQILRQRYRQDIDDLQSYLDTSAASSQTNRTGSNSSARSFTCSSPKSYNLPDISSILTPPPESKPAQPSPPLHLPRRKDGGLDLRYNSVKEYLGLRDPKNGIYLKKDGSLDMRYKVNREAVLNNSTKPTQDSVRYTPTKHAEPTPWMTPPYSSCGSPAYSVRYIQAIKNTSYCPPSPAYSTHSSASYSYKPSTNVSISKSSHESFSSKPSGPLRKDGKPDMRYKANW